MIKKIAILSSAVLCLSLTGCGASNSDKAEEGTQESTVVEEASKAIATIKHGLWFSPSSEKYYLFYEDKNDDGHNENAGVTSNLQDGMGIPFRYTLDGNEADISFWEADNHTPATVTFDGDNTMNIVWKNGDNVAKGPETLLYVSEMSLEEFDFYSNKEIYDQVSKHYSNEVDSQTSKVPSYITLTSWGKEVTVRFMESAEGMDECLAIYTIDRFTGKGSAKIAQEGKDDITKDIELTKEEQAK